MVVRRCNGFNYPQWRATVNTVMKTGVIQMVEKFLYHLINYWLFKNYPARRNYYRVMASR
jgi:hypothetical protein